MLSIYINSVIIYFIIYWALKRISKNIIINRDDVDYKKYAGKGKCMYYIFCFIPILRVLFIFILLFIVFAKKETLDELFNKNEEDK